MNIEPVNDVMNRLVDLLSQADEEYHRFVGGFPSEIEYLPGFIVQAEECGENGVALRVYAEADCLIWLEEIKQYQLDNPDEELWEAVNETTPEEWHWLGESDRETK